MKPIQIFILLCLVIVAPIFGQENPTQTLTVLIENVSSNQGKILLSIHNKENFMSSETVASKEKVATQGEMQFQFSELPKGIYAIMLLHDANGNYRMDFSENGQPKEAYATSGIKNLYGPPNFKDSSIAFVKDTLVRLSF
ncbi:MAG: DUF2141 domain-containing protein [Flavobacteriaceae bacterium]|nr:DUF2141 domain-containing protein [Flavobacteriaceae bacterium]